MAGAFFWVGCKSLRKSSLANQSVEIMKRVEIRGPTVETVLKKRA